MARIKGIEYPSFTFRSSSEVCPGSVPGPGALHDEYTCQFCGFQVNHQIYGQFFAGDEEEHFNTLIRDIEFHSARCKEKETDHENTDA